MGDNITIFDRPYSKEKQAEGIAISQSVLFGACDKCDWYKRCSTDETFFFPEDADCMKRKKSILREWGATNG